MSRRCRACRRILKQADRRNKPCLRTSVALPTLSLPDSLPQSIVQHADCQDATCDTHNCHCRTCCGNPSLYERDLSGQLHSCGTMDCRNKCGNDSRVKEIKPKKKPEFFRPLLIQSLSFRLSMPLQSIGLPHLAAAVLRRLRACLQCETQ